MFRPKSSISVYIVEHNDDDVDDSHKVVKCFADTREEKAKHKKKFLSLISFSHFKAFFTPKKV